MPTTDAAFADPLAATVPVAVKPAATRYICVHGHFYQPPRENPWLETVELQESAAPFHDWNERITAECYAPNGASRIQNKAGEITRIVNNYAGMSYNFGPTLLSWLEDFAPRTYRNILDADTESAQRYSGHGSAVAQVYNHVIMPLASERDARTQIRWGIADFQQRFGRMPEGMWLAETAASRAVLDLMAQEGIKFTILAPHQCARTRPLGEDELAARTEAAAQAGREAGEDRRTSWNRRSSDRGRDGDRTQPPFGDKSSPPVVITGGPDVIETPFGDKSAPPVVIIGGGDLRPGPRHGHGHGGFTGEIGDVPDAPETPFGDKSSPPVVIPGGTDEINKPFGDKSSPPVVIGGPDVIAPAAGDKSSPPVVITGPTDRRPGPHHGHGEAELGVAGEIAGLRLDLAAGEAGGELIDQPVAASAAPEQPWIETPNSTCDPHHPYIVKLEEGREIAVFFYDGPTSRAVAFEGLLNSGEFFGQRLVNSLRPASATPDLDEPQLAHIATDGESYGHHHRHGEMALTYALHWIEEQGLAKTTNYGEFLERFPPTREAEIVEESSWSCFHGVERWRSDCGCNGGKPGWNQKWRGPLRAALNLLRDRTAPLSEGLAAPLFKDLWAARDAYIKVVLDRRPPVVDEFFAQQGTHLLSQAERTTALELMELQRHAQLMYTSCGWFFDEISGIETVQIIAYAGRVLQLAAQLFGESIGEELEAAFLDVLAQAPSNVPEHRNGAEIYRKWVRNQRVDLEHVGAHYAISSMFQTYPESGTIFCYDVRRDGHEVFTSGRGRIALGRANLRSRITEESEDICFAVLHLGDQNLSAAVCRYSKRDRHRWRNFNETSAANIRAADLPGLIRGIDGYFGETTYSLKSLFADEQRRILDSILNTTISEVEGSLMRIYEEHATLLDFLGTSNFPIPPALAVTARFAINASLRRALSAEVYDSSEVARLLRRAKLDDASLDTGTLSYAADRCMKKAMLTLEGVFAEQNTAALQETVLIAESLRTLPAPSGLWQAQNIWHDLLRRGGTARWTGEWREGFRRLGTALRFDVDALLAAEGLAQW